MPPLPYELTRTIPQLPLIPGVNNAMVFEVSAGGVSYRTTQLQVKQNILNNSALTGATTAVGLTVSTNDLTVTNGDLNLTNGDLIITNGDYLIQGSKYAFASSVAPLAGMFFDAVNGKIDYRNIAGDIVSTQRVSAANEPYFRWYDLAGNELVDWDANANTFDFRDATGVIQTQIANTATGNRIYFGDAGSATIGKISYSHTTNAMDFDTFGNLALQIQSDGGIFMPLLANGAGDADARYDTTSKELSFNVSARRFKTKISYELKPEFTSWIYDIPFCIYNMKNGSSLRELGIIAEDLEKLQPKRVGHNKKGEVMSYSQSALVIPALIEIQNLNKRLIALEA